MVILYLQGYGLEDEVTDHVEEDVLPLECDCGVTNSGHRKSCRKCGEILDEDNYLEGVEVESKVEKDVEEKAKQIQENIIENETKVTDDRINAEARKLVAEEQGLEAEDLKIESSA